jgi:trans-aconitate 2-methyltransferase
MNTGPREWDAQTYDRVSDPQFQWGLEVLDRLELNGDEYVMDAGCGSGRVTARMLERLPDGRGICVDASEQMIEKAREALGERASYRVADLAELQVDEPVDVVFSTATFHWVSDHDRLFSALHETLRPGGRLVAQCGGEGNVADHARAIITVASRPEFAPHFGDMEVMWNFASPEETAARLERIGFADVRTWRQEVRVEPDDPREYLETVVLGSHLPRVPQERRAGFVDAVLAELPEPAIEYVRLNLTARRPA